MYANMNGHLRPALLGRLCRRVDLKWNPLHSEIKRMSYVDFADMISSKLVYTFRQVFKITIWPLC